MLVSWILNIGDSFFFDFLNFKFSFQKLTFFYSNFRRWKAALSTNCIRWNGHCHWFSEETKRWGRIVRGFIWSEWEEGNFYLFKNDIYNQTSQSLSRRNNSAPLSEWDNKKSCSFSFSIWNFSAGQILRILDIMDDDDLPSPTKMHFSLQIFVAAFLLAFFVSAVNSRSFIPGSNADLKSWLYLVYAKLNSVKHVMWVRKF